MSFHRSGSWHPHVPAWAADCLHIERVSSSDADIEVASSDSDRLPSPENFAAETTGHGVAAAACHASGSDSGSLVSARSSSSCYSVQSVSSNPFSDSQASSVRDGDDADDEDSGDEADDHGSGAWSFVLRHVDSLEVTRGQAAVRRSTDKLKPRCRSSLLARLGRIGSKKRARGDGDDDASTEKAESGKGEADGDGPRVKFARKRSFKENVQGLFGFKS